MTTGDEEAAQPEPVEPEPVEPAEPEVGREPETEPPAEPVVEASEPTTMRRAARSHRRGGRSRMSADPNDRLFEWNP